MLHVGMARFYFVHCGSYHPLPDDMVLGDDGQPLGHTPLVVCPACVKVCWLSVVVDMDAGAAGAPGNVDRWVVRVVSSVRRHLGRITERGMK